EQVACRLGRAVASRQKVVVNQLEAQMRPKRLVIDKKLVARSTITGRLQYRQHVSGSQFAQQRRLHHARLEGEALDAILLLTQRDLARFGKELAAGASLHLNRALLKRHVQIRVG